MTIRKDYTKEELDQWYKYILQVNNGYHMAEHDVKDLLRLNHIIMESCHDIHNKNMLGSLINS